MLQEHYMSAEVHAGIVYDRFLFDLPKILDLCVLYGEGNRPILAKMIANLFEKQPKYVEDWCATIKSMIMVSENLDVLAFYLLSLSVSLSLSLPPSLPPSPPPPPLLQIFDKVSERVLNERVGEVLRLDESKP